MKTFNQYITEKIKLSSYRFKQRNNDFEYVDLGLPSGTLWAKCNVGAKTGTEYGDYFAWGETKPKKVKAEIKPKKVKEEVWNRDKQKCIYCGIYVSKSCANAHFIKRSQRRIRHKRKCSYIVS